MYTKKVVILGADSLLGRKVLKSLNESEFPADNIIPMSEKKQVSYGEKRIDCVKFDDLDTISADIVINCMDRVWTSDHIHNIWSHEVLTIDLSNAFNLDNKVPLAIDAEADISEGNLIACPSSIATAFCSVFKAMQIEDPKQIFVATYESVSNHGDAAVAAMLNETKDSLFGESTPQFFSEQIAHNVIPNVMPDPEASPFDGEKEVEVEINKILGKQLDISVLRAQVPVAISDGMFVEIRADNLKIDVIEKNLSKAPGIGFLEESKYRCPLGCSYESIIYVGRLKNGSNKVSVWCAWDNTEVIARNAVSILLKYM